MRRAGRYKLVPVAAAAVAARRQRSPGARAAGVAAALKPRGGIIKVPGSAMKKQQRGRAAGAFEGGKAHSAGVVYCPLYCRTGKCERRGKGCPFK